MHGGAPGSGAPRGIKTHSSMGSLPAKPLRKRRAVRQARAAIAGANRKDQVKVDFAFLSGWTAPSSPLGITDHFVPL